MDANVATSRGYAAASLPKTRFHTEHADANRPAHGLDELKAKLSIAMKEVGDLEDRLDAVHTRAHGPRLCTVDNGPTLPQPKGALPEIHFQLDVLIGRLTMLNGRFGDFTDNL